MSDNKEMTDADQQMRQMLVQKLIEKYNMMKQPKKRGRPKKIATDPNDSKKKATHVELLERLKRFTDKKKELHRLKAERELQYLWDVLTKDL